MKHSSLRATVVVATLLATMGLTAPASAGPAVPAGEALATVTATSGGSGMSAQAVITCTLRAHNPHKSSHVRGTINVVANWSCTAPVASLSLSTILWYSTYTYVSTGYGSSAGSSGAQANAWGGCTTGTYDGTASGTVVFPPGYSPPTGSGYHQGPAVYITCP